MLKLFSLFLFFLLCCIPFRFSLQVAHLSLSCLTKGNILQSELSSFHLNTKRLYIKKWESNKGYVTMAKSKLLLFFFFILLHTFHVFMKSRSSFVRDFRRKVCKQLSLKYYSNIKSGTETIVRSQRVINKNGLRVLSGYG